MNKHGLALAGRERRATFLEALRRTGDKDAALVAAQVSPSWYWQSCSRWPDFKAQCQVIMNKPVDADNGMPLHLVDPATDDKYTDGWDGTFQSFRSLYLGHESPWFHVRAVNAIETIVRQGFANAGLQPSKPVPPDVQLSFGGKVILMLWPPEHGKTSLWEDADNYFLARWPWFRITAGSEKQGHANKVSRFVRDRFAHDAPGTGARLMRARFGPFAPLGKQSDQPWAVTAWNVAKKPKAVQRDYSFATLGMGGSVIGTRADLLQVDDPQSRKSINQTEELVEVFRQDWLSRPGPFGFTVVLMNRVGEDDFPQILEDQGLVDEVIRVPVWDDERGWLWPERYSHEDYMGMRRRVGEDAWERNYMQRGTVSRLQTFNKAMLEANCNIQRSIMHPPPRHPSGQPASIGIGVDPGFGVTSMTVGIHEPTKYRIATNIAQSGLNAVEQQYMMLEDLLITYCLEGRCWVNVVTVETKAFQKGWIAGDLFLALQRKYGFQVIPYETGAERNDEDIGVPQMAAAMRRGEFDFPYADEYSRSVMDELFKEFCRWRPTAHGSKLRMDRVMATWFDFLTWRNRRRVALADPSQFATRGIR